MQSLVLCYAYVGLNLDKRTQKRAPEAPPKNTVLKLPRKVVSFTAENDRFGAQTVPGPTIPFSGVPQTSQKGSGGPGARLGQKRTRKGSLRALFRAGSKTRFFEDHASDTRLRHGGANPQ